jgi:hypothetical protein
VILNLFPERQNMTALHPAVVARQKIEKSIARAFVRSCIAAGHTFGIDNGGDEDEMYRTTAEKETLDKMMETDEDRVYVYRTGAEKPFGWVLFVYGNDGFDVIADYTDKPEIEALLTEAHAVASRAESRA